MTKDLLTIWRGVIPRRRTMDDIAEPIAKAYGLSLKDLKGSSRVRLVTHARQAAYAALMETGNYSSTQVGWYFGDRDHSTVLHGVKRHHERVAAAFALED